MLQPDLRPPLGEGHSRFRSEESAQCALAGSGCTAQLGEGAGICRVVGEDAGYGAEAIVAGPGETQGKFADPAEAVQRDALEVSALGGVRLIGREGCDHLAEQRIHGEYRGPVQLERVRLGWEYQGPHFCGTVCAVRVWHRRWYPYRAVGRDDPHAERGGHFEDSGQRVAELVHVVVVPVDQFARGQGAPGGAGQDQAVIRHHPAVYRKSDRWSARERGAMRMDASEGPIATRPTATPTATATATATAKPFRSMSLWATAHAIDDLYQGLVPAAVPYFVLERHYSYLAASGLTLAATLGSALPQPVVGLAVDRWHLPRLAAIGVAVAGTGLGMSGIAGPYALVWLCILVSGLGVAMFHPAAGRSARESAGESAAAMSVFAAGGSVGFFLAPVLATPALDAWGLGATALFVPPAWLIAFALIRRQRAVVATQHKKPTPGSDRWGPFVALTGVEVVRSAAFFGINTFIELYWLKHLHASHLLAGAALACFLVGGVVGTLLGGRIADRIGMVRTVQLGGALTVPMLVGLRAAPGVLVPLLFAVLTGVALNVPFAVLVKLGQDYLPGRPGTAAGVTLGLGVSAGGLMAPVFGLIAEHRGPQGVLTALCVVPVVGLISGGFLREPMRSSGT